MPRNDVPMPMLSVILKSRRTVARKDRVRTLVDASYMSCSMAAGADVPVQALFLQLSISPDMDSTL